MTQIRPSCRPMIRFTIARPIPGPRVGLLGVEEVKEYKDPAGVVLLDTLVCAVRCADVSQTDRLYPGLAGKVSPPASR